MSNELYDLTTFENKNWNEWTETVPGTTKFVQQTPNDPLDFYLSSDFGTGSAIRIQKRFRFTAGQEYLLNFQFRSKTPARLIVRLAEVEQSSSLFQPSNNWIGVTIPLPTATESGNQLNLRITFRFELQTDQADKFDLDNLLVRHVDHKVKQ
ncbi:MULTISPECIES: hypothetical protein [Pseudomonas]|jgi:hypothetical protein|uniref:hypothetical protein n=1 Tax=Pseudomonas TaxID=286 RepID=UPI00087DDE96|nr:MULTISPECIES: hypothetical protein [Pseudomonas]SDU50047.1 hypothetical protein SAMN05216237_6478 [Pseudomonas yamanorum]